MPGGAVPGLTEDLEEQWNLDWTSDKRNATRDLTSLRAMCLSPWPPLVEDMLDVATGLYLADVACLRGVREEWTRTIEIDIPVRDPEFWQSASADLQHLLYTLTRDNIALKFRRLEHNDGDEASPGDRDADVDCVCLLSGGLDSFAGAAMLLNAGRRPLLVTHQSGNATLEAAQRHVVDSLERLAPGQATWVASRLAPYRGPQMLPYPPPEARETSRRTRSLLFLVLGAAAAQAVGVSEVYLCENGVLTAALPLTPARSGSLTTRSTHPMVLRLFSDLLTAADLNLEITNPFVYQTKGEIIRRFLKPLLPPADILKSVSCWSAGRQTRQCGGCVPCILRRIALLSAGMSDDAYMIDVLATPAQYRGTDAYGNLLDLVTQASALLSHTDLELLLHFPQLLDIDAAGLSVEDAIRTLKRHAAEVHDVVRSHFPACASLLEDAVA
jgi:7-cyano-7-deazaguanine synthase in queuosine biosynthesis